MGWQSFCEYCGVCVCYSEHVYPLNLQRGNLMISSLVVVLWQQQIIVGYVRHVNRLDRKSSLSEET